MRYKEVEGVDEQGNSVTFKLEIPTGLDVFNKIKNDSYKTYEEECACYDIVEKELKALEIFKDKCKFELEERNTILHKKVVKVYYVIINGVLTLDLTQEEYELLKGALLWNIML